MNGLPPTAPPSADASSADTGASTTIPAQSPRPAGTPASGLTTEVVVVGAGNAGVAAAEGIAAGVSGEEPTGRAFARHPQLRAVVVDDARAGWGGWSGTFAVAALQEAAARRLSWPAAVRHVIDARRDVVARHTQRLQALQSRLGPQALVLQGRGRLAGRGKVLVEPRGADGGATVHLLSARRVVLATGCVPAMPEVTGLLDTVFVTATELEVLLDLDRAPATVAVLGAGSTGCALAQALARLGCTVTLIDRQPSVLAGEDPDAAALVAEALRRDGVRLLLGSPVVKVAPTLDGGAWLGTSAGGDVAAERFVLTAGWRAASAGLDLPSAGVAVGPQGAVTVDPALVTSAPEVFAAGGVVGGQPHATAALAMGAVTGANVVARRACATWSAASVATLSLTDPEVAGVGLTDPAAIRARRGAGQRVSTATVRWSEVPRAMLSGAGEGFVRVIVGGSSGGGRWPGRRSTSGPARVIGATVVGPRAGDLVAPLALAIGSGLPASTLATAVSADPTWSSALHLAATRACDRL